MSGVWETHPAKTAKPLLFAPFSKPDVRKEAASKKTMTTTNFPTVLPITDSAMMGHNNKTQKLTCTNVRSTRRIADSEYMNIEVCPRLDF